MTSLLRAATALTICVLGVTPALSAPPSTTLDVLHQDLLAVKASIDALNAVGPAKPSDVVIAIPFADQCANGFGGRVNRRLAPGSDLQAFEIPAGSAYMVTGVGWASTISPGGYTRFVLRQEGQGSVFGEGTIVNTTTAPAPMAGHVAFPSPIRFTTAAPCILLDGSLANTRTWVYGFLVNDQ